MAAAQIPSIFLAPSHRFSQKTKEFSDTTITTFFEDWEAISLLRGISNYPRVRQIWQQWEKSLELTEEDLKFAHKIAKELLDRHGDEILNYLISCPPKPFQVDESKELFSQLDVSRDRIANPAVRFLAPIDERFIKIEYKEDNIGNSEYIIKDDLKNGHYFKPKQYKFQVSFWVEKNGNKVLTRDSDIIVLRNVTTGQNLASISRVGEFKPFKNAYIPKPVINLFFKFCKDTKSYIINYGVDSGNCSYCDRELSNPRSIKHCYGKKCAENYKLVW